MKTERSIWQIEQRTLKTLTRMFFLRWSVSYCRQRSVVSCCRRWSVVGQRKIGEDKGRDWVWCDLLDFAREDTCHYFKGGTEKGDRHFRTGDPKPQKPPPSAPLPSPPARAKPSPEKINRSRVKDLYIWRSDVTPSLLRLVLHDFFIEVGGPFYPLETGKRDITLSFSGVASNDLPKPVAYFALRGFNERETVSLLGAHSIGTVHCSSFLNLLRSRCYNNHTSPSPSSSSAGDLVSPPSPQVPGVEMDYEGKGSCFSTLCYRSLLQGRGILCVDQQLTVGEETEAWVRAYGSDASLFRRDFAKAMMKPSNLGVLIAPVGQVRISCSKTV